MQWLRAPTCPWCFTMVIRKMLRNEKVTNLPTSFREDNPMALSDAEPLSLINAMQLGKLDIGGPLFAHSRDAVIVHAISLRKLTGQAVDTSRGSYDSSLRA